MTSKSVYQEFDENALAYYGLDSAPKLGVLSTSLDSINHVISVDESNFEFLKSKLHSETLQNSWNNYKRAFVLPKCSVSLDRIKSVAKENKIVIVNDYTKADFIISHDNFWENLESGELIKSSLLMGKLWNYSKIINSNGYYPKVEESGIPLIVDSKIGNINVWKMDMDYMSTEYFVTGLALNIAYNLDTSLLKGVVDVNNFLNSAKALQPLTEELVQSISQMINSRNDEDLEIVGKLLPTINSNINHHLLWQLFQEAGSIKWKFNRNKDVQHWLNNLLYDYKYSSAEQMILELKNNNALTKESFKFFEILARKDITIYNRELYNFQVSIKPEYKEYLL